jgi:hypothetical protein
MPTVPSTPTPVTKVTADGHQQVDDQALVQHLGELKRHAEDGSQEAQVEEQEERFEKVVRKVVPEFMGHNCSFSLCSGGWRPARASRGTLGFRKIWPGN